MGSLVGCIHHQSLNLPYTKFQMRKSVILVLSLFSLVVSGQSLQYARSVVETLASDTFYGRGYVNQGEKKAALFIAQEFDTIGLKPIGGSFFHKFNTSVNSFPGKMRLTINDKRLKPGIDFLIEPGSPAIKGNFEVQMLSVQDMLMQSSLIEAFRNLTGKFLIISAYNPDIYSKEEQKKITEIIDYLKYSSELPIAGCILLTNSKLTWGGATYENIRPSFIVTNTEFEEIKNISIDVETTFFESYESQNVVGYLTGKHSDSLVLLVGHYDHLGMMGTKTIFPGANDNASGVAMLLSIANHYVRNPPNYNLIFIAFGGEEIGLVGARAFVENPPFDLSKIKFLLNFDISGTGEDGIQVVNGSVYKKQFDRLKQINDEKKLLHQVKVRGEACNSDHCLFHRKGIPCFYIYTLGGIQAYHDIYDRAETLSLTEFEDYFQLIREWIDGL